MVFKIVSGVQRRVWELYSSSNTSAELVTAALDVTNQHHDHYKNRIITNWTNFNPTQVSVGNCTNSSDLLSLAGGGLTLFLLHFAIFSFCKNSRKLILAKKREREN